MEEDSAGQEEEVEPDSEQDKNMKIDMVYTSSTENLYSS